MQKYCKFNGILSMKRLFCLRQNYFKSMRYTKCNVTHNRGHNLVLTSISCTLKPKSLKSAMTSVCTDKGLAQWHGRFFAGLKIAYLHFPALSLDVGNVYRIKEILPIKTKDFFSLKEIIGTKM